MCVMESMKFEAFLEEIAQAEDTADAIRLIEEAYEHDFTTFHVLANPAQLVDNPFVRTTYPDAWVTQYLLNNYAKIDPVVEKAFLEGESFNWDECRLSTRHKPLFEAMLKFGIGQSGYSFVFEDELGRHGLFSINSRMEPREWRNYIEPKVDEFEKILPLLHAKAMREIDSEKGDAPRLTTREYECLRLSSEGHSYSEIAKILDLSEHTVRGYLKMVRIKLACTTLAQAAAKAVRLRLI